MKIAILTPIYGQPEMAFTRSLGRMLIHTVRARPDLELELFDYSAVITDARTWLVRRALEWEADAVLWADADHAWPPEALLRLLELDRDIVGANYVRRSRPTFPIGMMELANGTPARLWTTKEAAEARIVQEAMAIGLGLCLVRRAVFDALPQPLFAMQWGPDGMISESEDGYFIRKAREAGFKLYVDHWLSWQVEHVARLPLSHADALADNPGRVSVQTFTIGGAKP